MDNQVGEGSSQKLRDHKNCRGMLKHPRDEQDEEDEAVDEGEEQSFYSAEFLLWRRGGDRESCVYSLLKALFGLLSYEADRVM